MSDSASAQVEIAKMPPRDDNLRICPALPTIANGRIGLILAGRDLRYVVVRRLEDRRWSAITNGERAQRAMRLGENVQAALRC